MKNKGITLIALVVTIIVLLLLAGISIQMLTGDNGLLQKTVTAKQANEEATELELIKLAVTAAQISGSGKITTENLNRELQTNFNNDNTAMEIANGWYYKTQIDYFINKQGHIEYKPIIKLELKEVKKSEIILELNINAYKITHVHILDSLTQNTINYDNINSDSFKIEISTQINATKYIEIQTNSITYTIKNYFEYSLLGVEGASINNLPEGYYAYGANGKYYYKKMSGNVSFSNGVFGDPIVGTKKNGYKVGEMINE